MDLGTCVVFNGDKAMDIYNLMVHPAKSETPKSSKHK